MNEDIPPLDEKTIEFLLKIYPEETPKITQSDREIWIAVGKRQAALEMKRRYELQRN